MMAARFTRVFRPATRMGQLSPVDISLLRFNSRLFSTVGENEAILAETTEPTIPAPSAAEAAVAVEQTELLDALGRAYATGRRKASVARVWLQEGQGKISVNGMDHTAYFSRLSHRTFYLSPLYETNLLDNVDVMCTVKGGGISGQSGAIAVGVAHALTRFNPELRPILSQGTLESKTHVCSSFFSCCLCCCLSQ